MTRNLVVEDELGISLDLEDDLKDDLKMEGLRRGDRERK
jgi:hypothetical protein